MILFLRLLIAHLIGDFILQPSSWVEDKNAKGIKSLKLFFHIAIVTIVSVIFTLDLFSWQIPVYIFVIHYLTDLAKIYLHTRKISPLLWFLLDQLMHIIGIAAISLIIGALSFEWLYKFQTIISSERALAIILAYVIVIWPAMIIINLATKQWQKQITREVGPSLENAGKWIGVLERILVLTFVLGAQFQAIGFLIAAKSILRISVKTENSARLLSEYVLIGTFISFTIAILIGLLARAFI